MDKRPLHERLTRMADDLEAKLEAASMLEGPDGQDVADLRTAAKLAKPPAGGTAILEMILAAFDELAYRGDATRVCGLVVHHRGYSLQLIPDVENRGWSALGMPDAEDENGYPLHVIGDGPTPEAALDACAAKCYEAEDVAYEEQR